MLTHVSIPSDVSRVTSAFEPDPSSNTPSRLQFLLTLLQCIPTRGFWDKTIDASCNVDSQKFLFAISIPNILIDVTILSLPVPYVKKLNISTSQRRLVLSMFLLGGLYVHRTLSIQFPR